MPRSKNTAASDSVTVTAVREVIPVLTQPRVCDGETLISSHEITVNINKHMPRTGTRPHVWKVQGKVPHDQYCAWLQSKAQANYRGEQFALTFEQYQELWHSQWDRKGRGRDDYCLTRKDPEGPWSIDNAEVMPRIEHLRRQRLYKLGRGSWPGSTTKNYR